ncbi:MAG: TonB-dependent receptor [bacterium]|nr:TonB-dependent receptor [bacterium]
MKLRLFTISLSRMVLLALGFLIGVFCPPATLANDSPDYTEFSLEDLMEMNVVYGASKIKQKAKEAPSSITIISREEIKTYGYRTMAEVLASLRGFYVTYDRNYYYIGVRGLGTPGDLSSRILVLVDGIRTNEGSVGGVMTGNGFPVDLELIERIEVIRGPASSLYGTNAMLGIINVVTREGYQYNGVEVQVGHGSYGNTYLRATGGYETESGLDLLFSGSYGQVDGQDHYIEEFNYPSYNHGLFEDGDSEEWYNMMTKAIYKGFTFEAIYGWRFKQNPMAPVGVVFNDNSAHTQDTSWSLSTKYKKKLNWDIDFSAQVFYQHFKWDGEWPYDFDYEGNIVDYSIPYVDDFRGEKLTGMVDMTKRLPGDHAIALGAEYVNNFQMDMSARDLNPYYKWYDFKQAPENWGVYLLTEIHLTTRTLLNLGVRHDEYTTFGGSTNPRLALVTEPIDGTVFKILYGTAFRAPNGYEIAQEESQGQLEYTPEDITTYELIWEQSFGNGYSTSVTGYLYDYRLLKDDQYDQSDLLPEEWVNDEIESTGFEVEVVKQARQGVTGRLSYSYNDAKERLFNPLIGESKASPHMAKLNLSMPFYDKGTRAGLEIQYNSKRLTIMREYAEYHYLMNLSVLNNSLIENVELKGSIYNLLNEPISHPGTMGEYQERIWQDGRSYRLYLTISN